MELSAKTILRTVVGSVGGAVAGPAGAIVGGFAGGLLGSAVPFISSLVETLVTDLTSGSIQKVSDRIIDTLTPSEQVTINHDLQNAFREALRQALFDTGGAPCFPREWKNIQRNVPEGVVFATTLAGSRYWRADTVLGKQVEECLRGLEQALQEGEILPIDPPQNEPGSNVTTFLGAANPQELNQVFFEQVIAPYLKSYRSLAQEVPELEPHLRRHLLDRTLVHLGEQLKTNTEAWRAFNRMLLEDLHNQMSLLGKGQADLAARLEPLVSRADGSALAEWSNGLADLLAAAGQIEKTVGESYEALASRVTAQHGEVLERMDALAATANRIERKVERVLRYLEDGHWQIEGSAPVLDSELPAPGEAPFKGLQSFTAADSALFFGREQLTARLAARLRQQSFLAVVGASGSGKSSAVRAGLLPALRSGAPLVDGSLPPVGSYFWPQFLLTPTAHPLEALALCLTGSRQEAAALVDDLQREPRTLDRFTREQAAKAESKGSPSPRLLLVVDQFEELFTLCHSESERAAFLDNLLYAANGVESGPLKLVITLRADFYAHCAQYEGLRAALSAYQEYIGPMSRAELRRAIEEPARLGNWIFERGLVEIILQDVGQEPGALPLLSHALLETWKRRRGRMMTLESYAESGGVRGAIALTAESVYTQQFDASQQALARRIFLRLTELGEGTQDTRRRAALDELAGQPQEVDMVRQVLGTLADARLLTIHETTVEVAHEALIREWP